MAAFRFDGKRIETEPGDTIASALHRAGVRVVSRSMKYHRPRGLYCNTGSCASCLVGVDGVPNLPACMTQAEDVQSVESQNRIGSAQRDLLAVVDAAYPHGFDPHGAFTRPRLLNAAFVKAVRFMSGWGKAPEPGAAADSDIDDAPTFATLEVDELIIGAGTHGLTRAAGIAGMNREVLIVDEMAEPGGGARYDPDDPAHALLAEADGWRGVTMWGDALAFGIYGDVVAVRKGNDLWAVKAGHITIAPGLHDDVPMWPGNDLPGVMSMRGAMRLLREHDVLPGRRIVVDGDPLPQSFVMDLAEAGGEIVGQGDVDAAHGRSGVRAALIDGRRIGCDMILVNRPGLPRLELFQQAGCAIGWSPSVQAPAPVADAHGRTSQPRITAHFAPGICAQELVA